MHAEGQGAPGVGDGGQGRRGWGLGWYFKGRVWKDTNSSSNPFTDSTCAPSPASRLPSARLVAPPAQVVTATEKGTEAQKAYTSQGPAAEGLGNQPAASSVLSPWSHACLHPSCPAPNTYKDLLEREWRGSGERISSTVVAERKPDRGLRAPSLDPEIVT